MDPGATSVIVRLRQNRELLSGRCAPIANLAAPGAGPAAYSGQPVVENKAVQRSAAGSQKRPGRHWLARVHGCPAPGRRWQVPPSHQASAAQVCTAVVAGSGSEQASPSLDSAWQIWVTGSQ